MPAGSSVQGDQAQAKRLAVQLVLQYNQSWSSKSVLVDFSHNGYLSRHTSA
jgi:hypothetical protein